MIPMVALSTVVAGGWPGGNLTKLDGSTLNGDSLKNKVVLLVNVASKCGFTKQYEGLQALYKKYQKQGLVVVGVPCNQFGGQEPGTADEIQKFCKMNFGVTFPLLVKQDVNGDQRSPLYAWLVDSDAGKGEDIKWNFEKFLVGRDGKVRARYRSAVAPNDPALISAIEKSLR